MIPADYTEAVLRAVLFDFDGLILDTETPEVEILRDVFAEHGQLFPDEYWIHAFGRGADQIYEKPMELLQRLCGRELDLEWLESERRRRTVELIEQQPIRPGIVELLEEARRADLRLGVASSSKHWWVDGHLERLGLREFFEVTVCADDVVRAKPFPDLYQRLMDEIDADPSCSFALEDSPNGVRAAKDAGLYVVAVENPLSSMLNLSAADRVIPTLQGHSLAALSPF